MRRYHTIVGVLEDVIEQKMQEDELEAHAEHLFEGWALYQLLDHTQNAWGDVWTMDKLLKPLTVQADAYDRLKNAMYDDGLRYEIAQLRADTHKTELTTLQDLYRTYYDRIPVGLKFCRHFRIAVTDIAIILGISPYDCVRTFESLVRSNNPESYTEEDEVLQYSVLVREGNEIFASDGVRVHNMPENAVAASSLTGKPASGTVMYVDMTEDITEQLRLIDLHAGIETSKKVYTAAGCAGESETYKLYEDLTAKSVEQRQVRRSSTWGGLRITGMVDGIVGSQVLEIKNRMKSFKGVNPWDACQMQFYMWIHGLEEAQLVERIGTELKLHTIRANRRFIDHSLEQLDRFVLLYYQFLEIHVERYNGVRNRNRYLKQHLFGRLHESL